MGRREGESGLKEEAVKVLKEKTKEEEKEGQSVVVEGVNLYKNKEWKPKKKKTLR